VIRPDSTAPAASVGGGLAVAASEPVEAAGGPVLVQFRLEAPDARDVRLAADFTGWRPAHALHRSATGVWTVVVAVAPGVHEYGFVVDGERWTPDPLAPQVDDGFGGSNSRLDVISLEGAAL
jgi:1,4-alpha-glucan branching enzyme